MILVEVSGSSAHACMHRAVLSSYVVSYGNIILYIRDPHHRSSSFFFFAASAIRAYCFSISLFELIILFYGYISIYLQGNARPSLIKPNSEEESHITNFNKHGWALLSFARRYRCYIHITLLQCNRRNSSTIPNDGIPSK